MTENLLAIGEFSTLSRLSVRMLRHYDQHDVLPPARIDDHSGYRFYAHAQLVDAARVRHLRDAGVPVAAMREVLAAQNPDEARKLLLVHLESLREVAAQAQRRSEAVDILLTSIQEHPHVGPVSRISIPATWAVTFRTTIPTYDDEGDAWDGIMSGVPTLKSQSNGQPCGAIYHDGEYKEQGCDVEIYFPIRGPIDTPPTCPVVQQPALEVLAITHKGPFDLADEPIRVLGEEMGRLGLQQSGPMRWRYLVSPGQTDNPQEYVTEICLPV